MTLREFTELLNAHPEKPFQLILPGAQSVPACFHITEVAHVAKTFLDCGGKRHTMQRCQLQVWLGGDTGHRLLAGKMARVLRLAEASGVLPRGEDLDVEIEYEETVLSQYTVAQTAVTEAAVVLHLAAKHTDCLAKDVCLPSLPMAAAASCGCGPGGCEEEARA